MTVVAHVSGAPLEEMLALACGGSALWAAARVWTSMLASSAGRTARRLRRSPNRKAV